MSDHSINREDFRLFIFVVCTFISKDGSMEFDETYS